MIQFELAGKATVSFQNTPQKYNSVILVHYK
jgi:hypothetical protein